MSVLKLYKSYSFRDKDPIIDEMRTMIKGHSYIDVAAESGVSHGTLYNWFNGETKRPQYATVMAVVKSLGYEVTYTQKVHKIPRRKSA